jgi:hypothetical protein
MDEATAEFESHLIDLSGIVLDELDAYDDEDLVIATDCALRDIDRPENFSAQRS